MNESQKVCILRKKVKVGKLIPKKILFKVIYVGKDYGSLRKDSNKKGK